MLWMLLFVCSPAGPQTAPVHTRPGTARNNFFELRKSQDFDLKLDWVAGHVSVGNVVIRAKTRRDKPGTAPDSSKLDPDEVHWMTLPEDYKTEEGFDVGGQWLVAP